MFVGVREALSSRSFRALFVGTLLTYAGWGVASSLSLHLGTYFWMVRPDQLFIWGVGMYLGIFVGLPFWRRQAALHDKKPVFVWGLAGYTLFLAGPTFAKLAGYWPETGSLADLTVFVLTTGTLSHFALASTMVTGRSMMADVTDEDELRHGRRREGIFFGASSFSGKAFFGIGSQIAGVIIDLVGLRPGALPDEVGHEVVRGLGLALGLSILLMMGLAAVVFSRYDLTRARHEAIRAQLESRAGAAPRPGEALQP
jgi:GPH family glycoside/pentoside/hexuronide:cation symporter